MTHMLKHTPEDHKKKIYPACKFLTWLNGLQDMHKKPSGDGIVYNAMNNNHCKQKHSKVLEGSQKCCENKIDFVCKFYGNSTEL